jgi:3-phenylpropionate/trans-cinnamate dioxygenase ferredoxin subunit
MQTPETKNEEYQFYEVIEASEIPPGERLFIEIDDQPIIIFNVDGEFYAVDDECTHDNGPLSDGDLEGHCVTCPRHGAMFDIRSGKVKSLPAVKDISTYPIQIIDGVIEIGVVIPD